MSELPAATGPGAATRRRELLRAAAEAFEDGRGIGRDLLVGHGVTFEECGDLLDDIANAVRVYLRLDPDERVALSLEALGDRGPELAPVIKQVAKDVRLARLPGRAGREAQAEREEDRKTREAIFAESEGLRQRIRDLVAERDAKDRMRLAQRKADRTGKTVSFVGSDDQAYLVDPQDEVMAERAERDALRRALGRLRAFVAEDRVRSVTNDDPRHPDQLLLKDTDDLLS